MARNFCVECFDIASLRSRIEMLLLCMDVYLEHLRVYDAIKSASRAYKDMYNKDDAVVYFMLWLVNKCLNVSFIETYKVQKRYLKIER